MSNILLTTDFSEESRKAYPVAIKLAKQLQVKINLLFVSQNIPALASGYAMESPSWYIDPVVQEQIISSQKADLEKEKQKLLGSEIQTHFVEAADIPSVEIIKLAKELKSELIVMASHGRTGFARIILGSITERVLHDAPCPVVVVPTKNK